MRGLVPTISTLSRHHSPEPSHQNRGRPVESDRNQTHIKKWVSSWNTISKFVFSILFELKNPLNVLVLGPHDSGKTTVINSLLMAVRKQWTDRARYGHGGRHQFAPVLLYENPNHHRRHNGQSYHNHEWVFFRITYRIIGQVVTTDIQTLWSTVETKPEWSLWSCDFLGYSRFRSDFWQG